MSTKPKRCFVIMPFSETSKEHTEKYWTGHFESFLKPLIEEFPELEAHRSEPLRVDILRQIIKDLVVSPIVVADLTDENPNVYWELGVRQSFKHCTVTIAEEGTEIPFDISVKGTLFYSPKDHIKNAKFIKKFKKAIRDCLTSPDSPDSHVLEAVSGRGSLFEIIRREEAIRRIKALISECKKNIETLGDIYDRCEKNQKEPEKRAYVTGRLLYPAVELLITHRYLDEEDAFYKLAESCFAGILARNEQLAVWEQSPNITEKWFLRYTKGFIKTLEKHREKLSTIQKKLTAAF